MNEFDKLKILLQLAGKGNLSPHLDAIKNLTFLRRGLKKNPILKGNYTIGDKNNTRVRHNSTDELINKITEDFYFNRHRDINPNLNINRRFGADDKWGLGLNLNKYNPNLNIGGNFGSENNWQANLGLNLGQNKGINFNIGRSF